MWWCQTLGEFSATEGLWTDSAEKKAIRGNYCLLHLRPLVNQALSVRAVPHQEQLCLFDAGIVRKPGITLDFWAELPVHQQIVLSAKSFLDLGNMSSPCSVLHCWLQKTWDSGDGWAGIFLWGEIFWHSHNCVFSCSDRKKDCLPYVSTLFRAWWREKAKAILSFPSEFPWATRKSLISTLNYRYPVWNLHIMSWL